MSKLPISLGILSWKDHATLAKTLETYKRNGILEMVGQINLWFNEATPKDLKLAKAYNLSYIECPANVGIGKAFVELAKMSTQKYFIPLENDWHLIEDAATTIKHLSAALKLMEEQGFDMVRLRHRRDFGHPHFSHNHHLKNWEYYDAWHEKNQPHLLDSIHWIEHPEVEFSGKISKFEEFFTTTSRYGNRTNNPCLWNTLFYVEQTEPFMGNAIDLERNVAKHWSDSDFKVAHGEGLFKHVDLKKYGKWRNFAPQRILSRIFQG
tara:strand:- start:11034 stop:11828 length:795 start_codon:yes stop_codon:yes gene_type:complete